MEETGTDMEQLQERLEGLSTAAEGVHFEDLWDEKKLKIVPRKLCDLLCVDDLLQLSLCSKSIHEKVRAALNKYKETLLHVDLDNLSERGVAEVKLILCSDDPSKIFYSGLNLTLGNPKWPLYKDEKHLLDHFMKAFIPNMETKVVRFQGAGWTHSSLMMKVLKAVVEQVETIEIKDHSVYKCDLGRQNPKIWPEGKMKKLIDLKLDPISSICTEEAIFEILANAPNLKKLDGPVDMRWFGNSSAAELLQGKILERVQFEFGRMGPEERGNLEKFVAEKPQLVQILTKNSEFVWGDDNSDDHSILAQILGSLLQSSKDSLQVLGTNLMQTLRFQSKKLLPQMSSLKLLQLHGYNSRGKWDDGDLIHLNALDYSTHFPNLNRVEILLQQEKSSFPHQQKISPGPSALCGALEPKTAICTTVTQIVITYGSNDWNIDEFFLSYDDGRPVDWQPFETIGQVFPNVRHVCLNGLRADRLTGRLRALWTVWPEIESITLANIEGKNYEMKEGIDHAILGVDKETVKTWRKLNQTEFIPCGPSILDKQKLRKFRLEFLFKQYLEDYSSDISSDDSDFVQAMICGYSLRKYRTDPGDAFISSVVGSLAFSKIPGLTLEVYEVREPGFCPDDWFCVDHLKTFVDVRVWQKPFRIQDVGH